MNAYLSSTTFWGTPTHLFGTAPSALGEWGSGATVCAVAATLVALCVAARALEIIVERRRERKREKAQARRRLEREARAAVCNDFWKNSGNNVNYATASGFDGWDDFSDRGESRRDRRDRLSDKNKRSDKEGRRPQARFVSARVAAFWTVVALGMASVWPTLRSTAPTEKEREDAAICEAVDETLDETVKETRGETTFAATDVERDWSETNVEFRAVADSEGTRLEGASLLQNAEDASIKRNKTVAQNGEKRENKGNGKGKTVASSPAATDGASLIAERRAVVEGNAPAKARWVQTADGRLTQVAEIRAESQIEVPGNSLNSLNSAYPAAASQVGETTAAREANDLWRRRATEETFPTTRNGQNASTTQTAQVSKFAQSSQDARPTQRGEVPGFAAASQDAQAAGFAPVSQGAQAAGFAPVSQGAQAAGFAPAPQVLPTARPEQISQFEQTAQVLTAQKGETARLAQTSRIAQTSQVGLTTQNRLNGQSALNGQGALNGQNALSGQGTLNGRNTLSGQNALNAQGTPIGQTAAARDAVVASVYDASRGNKAKNALAQEFAPSEPLIPYPSEERRASIASVSYEPRPVDSLSLLEQIDAEFQRIGARVRKSVLSIEAAKRSPKTKSNKSAVETGCGFLFQYREKVYLATNMHVVKGAATNKSVKIFLPDRTAIHPTKIITSADFDLAALELDAASLPNDGSVALCYFGDSDELQVSNFVGTIGNPFGLRDTVTYGHVSSLQRRKNDFTSDGEKSLLEFVQIDASINPGNSGGPLYNARGEVVGVVAAIATTSGKSEGVAFAIPINLALTVLKSMIDSGGWSRSRMGVELEASPVDDFQNVADWPIKSGARIVGVNANSPAERAGLRNGDLVVEFEGEAIEDDVHLARLIAIGDVSRTLNVKYLRNGKLRETAVLLERSVAE